MKKHMAALRKVTPIAGDRSVSNNELILLVHHGKQLGLDQEQLNARIRDRFGCERLELRRSQARTLIEELRRERDALIAEHAKEQTAE